MELEGKKILLAEDDQLIGQMFCRRFKIAGAEVVWMFNGEDAADTIKNSNEGDFDIIISDLMMPKVDGVDFLKIVKADERLSKLPFIILTNRSTQKEETEEIIALGADGYIIKSETDLKDLIDKTAEILKSRTKF